MLNDYPLISPESVRSIKSFFLNFYDIFLIFKQTKTRPSNNICDTSFHNAITTTYDTNVLKLFIYTIAKHHEKRMGVLSRISS